MSKVPWIYCSTISESRKMELPSEELRHLVGSRRRRVGESFVLFDGAGSVAYAKLQDIKKKPLSGWAEIISKEYHQRPTQKTRLASALPKGDRQGLMLEFATQLGITDFIPLSCARSVARPGQGGYDRWKKIFVETCKQCQRPWLPDIHPESTPINLLKYQVSADETILLADENGQAVKNLKFDDSASDRLLLVGPEGGFTVEERTDLLERGAVPVYLSAHNLRIEVAATALVSLVMT